MSITPNIAATSFEWSSFKLYIARKKRREQKLELSGKYIIRTGKPQKCAPLYLFRLVRTLSYALTPDIILDSIEKEA